LTHPEFEDEPPQLAEVTDYDRRHFVTYLRILDALDEGADWREVAKIVLAIDPAIEFERAQLRYASHLARAQWMTKAGYRHLLNKG
jgi:hypothetical protein